MNDQSPVHLVVLIHGMWGSPEHVSTAAEIIAEVHSKPKNAGDPELNVLVAHSNRETHTYDGIDWGGERVADEIIDRVKVLREEAGKTVTRISVLGYSLGGLVARYVIGILYARDFFKDIQPVNFTTVATPHIGLVRYKTWFSSVAAAIGPRFLSRTGEQFYCADKWSSTGAPLLQVMVDKERVFYKALASFRNVTIYANAVKDRTVAYVTAAIELTDPFVDFQTSGIEISFDSDYAPLIESYSLPSTPPPPPPKLPMLSVENLKRYQLRLPPFLQRPFPVNVLIYAALPLLIPTFMVMVLVRFSLASRASRQRIKLLEKESSEPDSMKLINLLREIEQEVGDTIADLVDEPGSPDYSAHSLDNTVKVMTLSNPATESHAVVEPGSLEDGALRDTDPILTPLQKQMVASLNSIPTMKKKLAFIPEFVNSHATIICRDPVNFPFHSVGKGVIRHWADNFAL